MFDPGGWARRLKELLAQEEELLQVTREAEKYLSKNELRAVSLLFDRLTAELERATESCQTRLR